MPWFFSYHVYRLLHAGEIDKITLKSMEKCDYIRNHKLFERVKQDEGIENASATIAVPTKTDRQQNESEPKQTHRLFGEQDDKFVLSQIYFYYSFQLHQKLL